MGCYRKPSSESCHYPKRKQESVQGRVREPKPLPPRGRLARRLMKIRAPILGKYNKEYETSGGFKIKDYSKLRMPGMLVPYFGADTDKDVIRLARLAIKDYNQNNNSKHRFLKVKRANCYACAGRVYYITMHVNTAPPIDRKRKRGTSGVVTFQAVVYKGIGNERRVLSCKPKPKPNWIDLTGDGGVMKTIVRKVKSAGIAPLKKFPRLDVHYKGIIAETGEVFSTMEGSTVFTFEFGKDNVIKAWDVALRNMKVGEIAKITCQPEYTRAYDNISSYPPDIPPNVTLIFELELVACKPRLGSRQGTALLRQMELKRKREIDATIETKEKKRGF